MLLTRYFGSYINVLPKEFANIEYGAILADSEVAFCGLLHAAETSPKTTGHHILK